MHSNCCCSCSFEPEIIKIGQSSHKMYSNNIVNFQESTTTLNACTKKAWKLIEGTSYVATYILYYNINTTFIANGDMSCLLKSIFCLVFFSVVLILILSKYS